MPTPQKHNFLDDYSCGAHPAILSALTQTNPTPQKTYGSDDYCTEARQLIHTLIGDTNASIYFTPGGTSANLLSIASHLRPHESIIAPTTAHIVDKEGGAIEATGHQIISVACADGKLTAEGIRGAVGRAGMFAFQPRPRMVFVANATEVGTVYTRGELEAIKRVCAELGLWVLMDGARLGVGLVAEKSGLSLRDVYDLTDVFWIGGTKNGALFGEAVVIKDRDFGRDFGIHMKQRGALIAKSRVLGVQFGTLLREGLFWELARHANRAAATISNALQKAGFRLWAATESNQVFPMFSLDVVEFLEREFEFHVWEKLSENIEVVRFVTSWATEDEAVEKFCESIQNWAMARNADWWTRYYGYISATQANS